MLRGLTLVTLLGLLLGAAGSRSGEAARRCTITGTNGPDVLVGTPRRDVICGLGAGDVIRAGAGDDIIYGGRGDDAIYPGAGRDVAHGDSGSDTFFSVDGARDFIDGGPDSDRARIDRDRARSIERFFRNGKYPLVLAAGDIATCIGTGDDRTAILLDAYPNAVVATLGDTVYPSGSAEEFAKCYAPSWGRAKRRTRPAVGDHEYETPGASAYFAYFGSAAGAPEKGYYSYDIRRWHVVVLNTHCIAIGGCGPNSPETLWLRTDLAQHAASSCTLAYFHRPRFSSGTMGPGGRVATLFKTLNDAGAEVVLSGDDHFYERFAPQNADGGRDPTHGIRQFVVGTGGKSFSPFGPIQPNSEVRNDSTFGVLKLSLRPAGYAWEFIPVAG